MSLTNPIGSFIKENPILVGSGIIAVAGAGTALAVISRRKKKKTTKRRKKSVKRRKPRIRGKRRIIRGRGLGRGEIKHSGRGTKGTKVVRFRTKQGKMVSFKVKGTSKRRKGFVKRKNRRKR